IIFVFQCRVTVDRFNKNHIVNNLVEAYLKEHPEKCRPKEDLKELDAKNKIQKNMFRWSAWPSGQYCAPHTRQSGSSDDTDDSDATGSDTDSDSGPPVTICRQCPSYVPDGSCAASAGTLCGNAFGHLYWGCSRPGCRGCLAKFKDMNFAEACLSTIILNNEYESNVLKEGHTKRSTTRASDDAAKLLLGSTL
ncbi:hypothetical protein NP493_1201g01056, partial [Ridgeia piscesae]